jgi:lipopolysaccharide/colanic/teichoic acid biosynthesis glycosyltransferase
LCDTIHRMISQEIGRYFERQKLAGEPFGSQTILASDTTNALKSMGETLNPTGEAYINSWQKRALDLTVTSIAFPFVAPLMMGAAVAVKLDDPDSNVLYVSERFGQNGATIGVLKFRTMVEGQKRAEIEAEMQNNIYLKKEEDPRLTIPGLFLRQTSLDETPQLWNIATGDMSLVGPRPLPANFIDFIRSNPELADIFPQWWNAYSKSKPGAVSDYVTHGRAYLSQTNEGQRKRMHYDIDYLQDASLARDLTILQESARAIISRHGAF